MRNILKTGLLCSTILAMACGVAKAESLQNAVKMAVETNPEVGITVKDRLAIDQDLRAAEGGFYPEVDFESTAGLEYTNNNARDGDSMPRYTGSLTLRQMLFDGFGTASEVNRQGARREAAAFRVYEASEFIALDAVEAYLEVLRRTELLNLAETNVAVHKEYLGMVNRRLEGGGGTVADVKQAESRLSTAEATLTQAQGDVRDSQATYMRVVGMAPDMLERPLIPESEFPEDVEHAVGMALLNNPTVNAVTTDVTTTDYDVEVAQSTFYPNLDLEVSGNKTRNINGVRGNDDDATALLVMRWNLYRGGTDTAREKAAIERRGRAMEVLNRIRRETEESTRVSWNAFTTSYKRADDLQSVVGANEAVRDSYLAQFDIGQRSLLDLLDSENELFVSRGNLVTAEYTALFGAYRVIALTGNLLKALDLDAPSQAYLAQGE